jgi:hypothetical protein
VEIIVRTNRKLESGVELEALIQLQRVYRKLRQLKDLAASGVTPEFVDAINDFISAARRVTNYLSREPGRPTGFQQWVDSEVARLLRSDPRLRFFFDLRNHSEKAGAVVPSQSKVSIEAAGTIELVDSAEVAPKDPTSGEILAYVHYNELKNGRLAKSTITAHKRSVSHYVHGWPEDVLSFFDHVARSLNDLVERAYKAYPNAGIDVEWQTDQW